MKNLQTNIFLTLFTLMFLIVSCKKEDLTDDKESRNEYIEWENTIGAIGSERLYSIEQTTDGGYIIVSNSNSDISGDKTENSIFPGADDYWILKLNISGKIEWQRTIGGNGTDIPHGGIKQTSDGGYVIAGSSSSNISNYKSENNIGERSTYDYWIVKLDSQGTIIWENTIGGTGTDNVRAIIETNDGGYLVGGNSNSDITGDKTEPKYGDWDYWVVKLDNDGNIQWQKSFGGTREDNLKAIIQTTDNGYIIAGASNSLVSGNKTLPTNGSSDYWVVKISSSGLTEWQNSYGSSSLENFSSITPTIDGNYILGGYTFHSPGKGIWIVKISPNGSLISETLIKDSLGERRNIKKVLQTNNGSYIIASTFLKSVSVFQSFDYNLLNTDENGEILKEITFIANDYDEIIDLHKTSDGGFILGGFSSSDKSIDKSENTFAGSYTKQDLWVLKISSRFNN